MSLAALAVEIRRRAGILPARAVDPLAAIRARIEERPETGENRALAAVTAAFLRGEGEFLVSTPAALGREALGLVDALIERLVSGCADGSTMGRGLS